jgi:hypothetical protein
MGVACAVFLMFLLVFYHKDKREQATGRRSGCQHHQSGSGCHCQGQKSKASPAGPVISDKKRANGSS